MDESSDDSNSKESLRGRPVTPVPPILTALTRMGEERAANNADIMSMHQFTRSSAHIDDT